MGAFCSGCVRVLNHYSWRAKACRTERVFNSTEGLGLKSLETLLKNKSVYRKRFERRSVSQDASILSSGETGRVNIPLVSWWINWIAADQKPKGFLVKWPSPLSPWYLLSCVIQTLTMVSKKVVASLLLVYVVSMLAEQTEGFVPFFTQSDFRKMQVTPRNVL